MIQRLLITLIITARFAPAALAAEKPNIVLIYSDDQGYGDASCLNAKSKFTTPNLDRLAREGLTLTDGHCSDTVCTPSRYGLLTGRYSWRTELKRGVFGAERKCLIADGRMTLASLLRDHGYATAMVGKWHLGMDFPGEKGKQRDWSQPVRDMPLDKGFDYFWGIPASMNYGVLAWFEGRFAKVPPTQFTRKKPNQIAISDYRIQPPYQDEPLKPDDLEVAPDFVDSECLTRFTNRAIRWIDAHTKQADAPPFFLYLPFTSPHKPVIPIEKFRGQGEAGAYGEFMIETDHHIGRILQLLDDRQIADDTLIIFTSDNGPETTWKQRIEKFDHHSAGVYREGKRSIYEGGHRVPFLIRWPAKVKPATKLDAPICQTDLLATVAEMLGAKLPNHAGEDSNSFYAAMLDPGSASEKERPPIIHHAANGRFAIREGKWKLVMEGSGNGKRKATKRELYDLEADPSETKNVLAGNSEIADDLVRKITQIVKGGRSSPGEAVANDTPHWPDLSWFDQ